jgi:hypothetical protein
MRVTRKLGEQSETHRHANIRKWLGIAVLAAYAWRLVAKDLEFIFAAHFNLAIARPFRFGPLARDRSSGANLGLIDGPLARHCALLGRQNRFIRHDAFLGNTPFPWIELIGSYSQNTDAIASRRIAFPPKSLTPQGI